MMSKSLVRGSSILSSPCLELIGGLGYCAPVIPHIFWLLFSFFMSEIKIPHPCINQYMLIRKNPSLLAETPRRRVGPCLFRGQIRIRDHVATTRATG